MGRTDRSSIVIPAARGRIYAALLDPSALETWLPPDNMRGGLAASLNNLASYVAAPQAGK